MNRLLFICTGNYYRSRMAEEIFNYWSHHYNLDWEASSAGLRSDMSSSPNEGPISPYAVAMLEKGEYPIQPLKRWPHSVAKEDIRQSDLTICLNRPEHKSEIEQRFPKFADHIVYWEVEDIDKLNPEIAFQQIAFEIGQLIF